MNNKVLSADQEKIDKIQKVILSLEHKNKKLEGRNQYLEDQVSKLSPKLEPTWWHWIMEKCPIAAQGGNCHNTGNMSQSPVSDLVGEDLNLTEKVNEYREKQNSGETDYRCDCGSKLYLATRHAIADQNCVDDEDGKSHVRPLFNGQEHGSYYTTEEYIEALNGQSVKA